MRIQCEDVVLRHAEIFDADQLGVPQSSVDYALTKAEFRDYSK